MGTPPPILQANLGMADSLILMVLALVVFGPRRLPQIGRQIGKLMYEFRKASNDFKFQMEEELRNAEEADRRKREEAERQRNLALSASPQPAAALEAPAAETAAEPTATDDGSYPRESTHGDFGGQEAPAEDSYPRIQPPSTGETIAASRPGSATRTETPSAPVEAASTNPEERNAVTDDPAAVTEQAAHNG